MSTITPPRALEGVRVLVVEDDRSIAQQLARGLTREGCVPVVAATAREALASDGMDLVLLDLGLPDADGTAVCRELRNRSDVPIIVVTARDAERDRVVALDLGADDYVVKPFGFEELLARMRAVMRRVDRSVVTVFTHGPISVDTGVRQARIDGELVALTGKEFDILACLIADPERVISREEIFERVWDEHWYGPTKVLDVHLVALRRKLGDPSLIETVYGRGFRLAAAS